MKRNVLKISFLVALIIIVCSTVVNALSFTTTMTPSKDIVAPATEFTITFKVSNLDVGSNGINSFSGILEYDTTVFETITESNIDGLNSWTPTFNADNNKITLYKTTFVKSEEAVFQLTLKTKSEISNSKTAEVKLKEITASNSDNEITASAVATNIQVASSQEEADALMANVTKVNNVQTTNVVVVNDSALNLEITTSNVLNITNNGIDSENKTNTVNNTVSGIVNNVSNYAFNNTTNESEEDMPYTGVSDYIVYIILGAIAVALVFYVKYQKIG